MARAAVETLAALGLGAGRRARRRPGGGARAASRAPRRPRAIIPSPGPARSPPPKRWREAAARVGPDDEVWVLLSGGATSLLGAPVPGLAPGRAHRALRASCSAPASTSPP